ncbi:unnamed protein product, partial [Ascophyllum nodosum]
FDFTVDEGKEWLNHSRPIAPVAQKLRGYQPSYRGDRLHVCMCCHAYIKSMDQPGKVANRARGQLDRENDYQVFPCPRSRQRIWSLETGSALPSPVSLLISILREQYTTYLQKYKG